MAAAPPIVRSTEIRRIRTYTAGGGSTEQPFYSGVSYIINDQAPYFELEVTGPPVQPIPGHVRPYFGGRIPEETWISGQPYWQRFEFGSELSRDRRMGGFEIPLRIPSDVVIRYYVVPSKLLGVMDIWCMIERVETEIGRPIAWDPDRRKTVRSWFRDASSPTVSMVSLLLESIESELRAAWALRRDPPTEIGRHGDYDPVPECSLVSRWASRRASDLTQMRARIERDRDEYTRRTREPSPTNRREPLESLLQTTREYLERLDSLLPKVLGEVRLEELASPIEFGPITQRDHRLRLLLRAFAPSRIQIVAADPSSWSQFPPVSLNRLFEAWGVVWMVERLRSIGFTGSIDQALGNDQLEGARWILTRDQVTVIIDYEPHPAQLRFGSLPELGQRTVSAVEWAILNQPVDQERPLYGSEERCSPDYVVRLEGPSGRVLAVGDATLADPAHQRPREGKSAVVATYRRSIYWRVGEQILGCDVLGGFVIFPGPTGMWSLLERESRRQDIWLFCPVPHAEDSDASRLFADFINRLVSLVA